MKESLQKQIEDLKRVRESLEQMDIDDRSKRLARSGISKEIKQLNSELWTVEQREQSELETFNHNGEVIEIPRGLMWNGQVDYQYDDGVIYQFKKPYLEKDGSLHLWHYVWLDEGKRQTRLLVRTLGRDKYGDRYFLETNYFKDKRDQYSYMRKGVDINNQKYKKYVNKVLEYMRKHEGFEDFYQQKEVAICN
ncbi:hypothetical protein [Brevibacillus sp. NRS-1366]|uniref:hypothetical protein n=1 Tax=Brevibacillus sp. NRS-1366 TaxID=3233899 RepID=UPI003D1EA503